MTITTKRVFAALVAVGLLGVGVATAANSIPYQDTFETWSLGAVNGLNNWTSTVNDASVVTNLDYSGAYSGTLPLAASNHTQVVKLNTGGDVLTNQIDSYDASGALVFMDAMVQFVPSDNTPPPCTAADSGIKLALYANSSSNLVVYHGTLNGTAGAYINGGNVASAITSVTLDTAKWYRVTVTLDVMTTSILGDFPTFEVKIDGVPVTNDAAYTISQKDAWAGGTRTPASPNFAPQTGTWFAVATAGDYKHVTGIGFQGTGYIDDLVLNTTNPFPGGIPGPWLLTVVAGTGGGSDLPPGATIVDGGNTDIVYTATGYYWIDELKSNGVSVLGPTAGGTVYTQHLVGVHAAVSNDITFYKPSWAISYVFPDGRASKTSGDTSVQNGDPASAVFTPDAWYRVDRVVSDGGSGDTGTGLNAKPYDWSLTHVTAPITNTVTTTGALEQFGGQPPNAWASNYYNEAQAAADPNLATDYLLNVDPTSSYTTNFNITAISVVGGTVNVTVTLATNNVPLANHQINGKVQLWGCQTNAAAVGATNIPSAEVGYKATFNANGQVTNSFPATSGPWFFKTMIEPGP